jgi:hypothetical protein
MSRTGDLFFFPNKFCFFLHQKNWEAFGLIPPPLPTSVNLTSLAQSLLYPYQIFRCNKIENKKNVIGTGIRDFYFYLFVYLFISIFLMLHFIG